MSMLTKLSIIDQFTMLNAYLHSIYIDYIKIGSASRHIQQGDYFAKLC